MKQSYRTCYLIVGLVALLPVALRAVTWHRQRHQEVDAAMASAGEVLFKHEWTARDPLCAGGDGLGPVFNADSCVACHQQGGPGGSGGQEHNVTAFSVRPADRVTGRCSPSGEMAPTILVSRPRSASPGSEGREGVVHSHAVSSEYVETLALVHPELPRITQPALFQVVPLDGSTHHAMGDTLRMPPGVHLSQRNTPALFGAQLIDEIPDRVIIAQERSEQISWGGKPAGSEDQPVGRALRLADGRVGRFGWKGQTGSLAEFVRAACANELGLSNPGHPQPRPLGKPDYEPVALDLTAEQCDQLTAFVGSLPRPVERLPEGAAAEQAPSGKKLFSKIGCADCHTPDLGSVQGIYSDLLLHRMGEDLVGEGSYDDPPRPPPGKRDGDPSPVQTPAPGEWRTPPLWGVADSAPYLHDGRAATLEEAIKLHGGQGARAAGRFAALDRAEQAEVIAFLKTLRAP
jgi:CxxC motif-containing protein (DUF1111 family)